jgi:hypothetical protein
MTEVEETTGGHPHNNPALHRLYHEVRNANDLNAADDLITLDPRDHDPTLPPKLATSRGRAPGRRRHRVDDATARRWRLRTIRAGAARLDSGENTAEPNEEETMAIVVLSETPNMTSEQYDNVAAELGLSRSLPESCLAHIAGVGPDGSTWRDISV